MVLLDSEGDHLTPLGSLDWMGSAELDQSERELVSEFRAALQESLVIGTKVLDIDTRMHLVDNPNKAIDQQLLPDVEKKGSAGHFVLSPEYAWLEGAGLSNFRIMRSGRAETSAHQVFFGALQADGDEDRGLLVAIKPCVERSSTACNDWLNAQLARRAGERSFSPVGYMLHEGRGYSITELDRGVETLDNSEWQQVMLDEGNPNFAGQVELLGDIAVRLAGLHKKNIFHEDPQFKNIALDISGEMFFIDWESSTFFQENTEPSTIQHKMEHDLKVLFGSMARSVEDNGVGLFSIFHHPIQWQLFKKYTFDPYMETYLNDEDEDGFKFETIAEVEATLQEYIESGAIYESLKRHRGHHN